MTSIPRDDAQLVALLVAAGCRVQKRHDGTHIVPLQAVGLPFRAGGVTKSTFELQLTMAQVRSMASTASTMEELIEVLRKNGAFTKA